MRRDAGVNFVSYSGRLRPNSQWGLPLARARPYAFRKGSRPKPRTMEATSVWRAAADSLLRRLHRWLHPSPLFADLFVGAAHRPILAGWRLALLPGQAMEFHHYF